MNKFIGYLLTKESIRLFVEMAYETQFAICNPGPSGPEDIQLCIGLQFCCFDLKIPMKDRLNFLSHVPGDVERELRRHSRCTWSRSVPSVHLARALRRQFLASSENKLLPIQTGTHLNSTSAHARLLVYYEIELFNRDRSAVHTRPFPCIALKMVIY